MRGRRFLSSPILWIGLLFAALMLRMDVLQPLLQPAFPGVEPVVYNRDSFLALFLSQLGLVAAASLAASLVGVGLAIFVTRPAGRDRSLSGRVQFQAGMGPGAVQSDQRT